MGRLDFTGDFLNKNKKSNTNKFSTKKNNLDSILKNEDQITEDFISKVCTKLLMDNPNTIPLVLDQGGLILFLLFEGEEEGNEDLIDAHLAINILGVEWEMVPKEHSKWIIQRHLDFISNTLDSIKDLGTNLSSLLDVIEDSGLFIEEILQHLESNDLGDFLFGEGNMFDEEEDAE